MSHVWKVKAYGTFCRWCGKSAQEYKRADLRMRREIDVLCDAVRARVKEREVASRKEAKRMKRERKQLALPWGGGERKDE